MIEVLQPGGLCSIQDLGRRGVGHLGVSPAGALDPLALRLANRLVGNPAGSAALEILLPPARFRFLRDGWLALTGCDCQAMLDDSPVWPGWRTRFRAGQQLSLRPARRGLCAYLAVDGGLAAAALMGSVSTDLTAGFGGQGGRPLQAGEQLATGAPRRLDAGLGIRLPEWTPQLRVMPGPEYDWFDAESRARFWQQAWQVGVNSNRMGFRLQGPALARCREEELRSSGVLPGVIQVPANGQPIILAAEAQSTGGYPRIGVVIQADRWRLGQARPGSRLHLVPCDRDGALAALHAQRQYLGRIELALARGAGRTEE